MSRIGRKPIDVPSGVQVEMQKGNLITVKGPKGTLSQKLPDRMVVEVKDSVITVDRPSEEKRDKSMHGLTRTSIANMVTGVTEQFKKVLELNGVGYRATKSGKTLNLMIGKSHPTTFDETEDIKIEVPDPNHIVIMGCDKQKVGEFAAVIRKQRPVEPYKQKGFKYEGERVKKKEGKTGSKK